ncbi:hypothetical protein [Kibdelosporangium philippinense]|nr:hypothetical protein [Kibdelosporangium philippinense]
MISEVCSLVQSAVAQRKLAMFPLFSGMIVRHGPKPPHDLATLH